MRPWGVWRYDGGRRSAAGEKRESARCSQGGSAIVLRKICNSLTKNDCLIEILITITTTDAARKEVLDAESRSLDGMASGGGGGGGATVEEGESARSSRGGGGIVPSKNN